MNNKTKDCVFSVVLAALGIYVLVEGLRMVVRASKPPYNIDAFRISPGMLPVVLGLALLVFTGLLLVRTLRGANDEPAGSLVMHLRAASVRFRAALGEANVKTTVVSTVIMFIYTFFVVGEVPFWIGGFLFLVALMWYLRATRLWVIVVTSGTVVALTVLLFQVFFKTTLP